MANIFTTIFTKSKETVQQGFSVMAKLANSADDDVGIFKAYMPEFLYNPPYGIARKANLPQLKMLAKNPYVFSISKNLADQMSLMPWKIKVKEEFQDDGKDYKPDIKKATKFFRNPNGNDESFENILKQVSIDLDESDGAVIVKVFSQSGEMVQIFSRDGGTFLKNPDIFGYMGNRAEFVAPLPRGFDVKIGTQGATPVQQEIIKTYDVLYKPNAAYFQYGWGGSMPVPFGKREIVYITQNPRQDSIYGRSPLEVLESVVLSLVYGSEYNLDFYTNNNMPEGMIALLGAQEGHIKQFRENFESKFRFKDAFGKMRKKFFNYPIANTEAKFIPFQMSSKDMELIAQQTWFTKVLWMCWGVTADEMGFTEKSNKTNGEQQTKNATRRAIKPRAAVIAYHLNTQLLPEFYVKGGVVPDFSEIPIEFVFDEYDLADDLMKHTILEQEIRMGVKTPEMVAKELGIDVTELKKQKDAAKKEEIEHQKALGQPTAPGDGPPVPATGEKKAEPEVAKPEEKSVPVQVEKESDQLARLIDAEIDVAGKEFLKLVESLPEKKV